MFRDLLRHRLEQQKSDLIPRLHFHASHWFEQNGYAIKDSQGNIILIDPYFPHDRPADRFVHAEPPLAIKARSVYIGDGRTIPLPDLRTAAQTVAIGRCRDAALQRGVWP